MILPVVNTRLAILIGSKAARSFHIVTKSTKLDKVEESNAGFEWSSPPGLDLAACCDAWAGVVAAVPARRRVELLRVHRRARPGGRGRLGPAPGRVLRQPHPGPAGHDRHRVPGAGRPGLLAGRPLHPGPGQQGGPQRRARRNRQGTAALPDGCSSANTGRCPGLPGRARCADRQTPLRLFPLRRALDHHRCRPRRAGAASALALPARLRAVRLRHVYTRRQVVRRYGSRRARLSRRLHWLRGDFGADCRCTHHSPFVPAKAGTQSQ